MVTALVTGGSGFIGSYLVEALLDKGDNVYILDDLSTGTYANIEHLESRPGFKCVVDDVRNEEIVESIVKKVDCIYHLAAAVGVALIVQNPVYTIETNIRGTEVVLKYASRYRKKVLLTSTSEVYGKSDKAAFREDDDRVMGPTTKSRWAYAGSKAMDEFLAQAYWMEKRLPTVVVRLFNTVGPKQTGQYGMVIPRFVSQALAGEPITVYGDGKQSRCFTYVGDVIPPMIKLMEIPDSKGEIYNLGSNYEITIEDLAEKVIELTGSSSKIKYISYKQAYNGGFEDMYRRIPDLTKINAAIGFEPKTSLEEILKLVIEHFRSKNTSVK